MQVLSSVQVKRSFGLGWSSLLLGALVGCSSSEKVGTTGQGQTAWADGTCTLELLVAPQVDAQAAPVVAVGAVSLGERAEARTADGSLAPVVAAGEGSVTVNASARVSDIWAGAGVALRNKALVEGKIWAETLERHPGSLGPSTAEEPGLPGTLVLSTSCAEPSRGNVRVEQGQAQTLAPGANGTVIVKPRGTLRLATGVYHIDSLQAEPDSTIELDASQGTVVILVRSVLSTKGKFKVTGGSSSDVLVGYLGSQPIALESEFDGTLFAPNASVTLGATPGGAHDGMFYANSIELKADALVRATPISGTGPAIAALLPTYTPNGETVPPPAPQPTGLTPEQYEDAVAAYFTSLKDSRYVGPAATIAPHPDAQGTEDVTGSVLEGLTGEPALPPGSAENSPNVVQEAFFDEYPELTPEYVKPPAFEPRPPGLCPLDTVSSAQPGTLPTESMSLKHGDEYQPGKEWDGFWGTVGELEYGMKEGGFFAHATPGLTAGFVARGTKYDAFYAGIDAYGSTSEDTDGDGDKEAVARASARLEVLGEEIASESFEASQELPWRVDICSSAFCDEPFSLFDMANVPKPPPISLGVGDVNVDVMFDANLPLSVDISEYGPEITFTPMARVFARVFVDVGFIFVLRAEGNFDLVRVDAPVTLKGTWEVNRSPDVCEATMKVSGDYRFVVSTLNGSIDIKLLAEAGVSGFSLGEVVIATYRLTEWGGIKYETEPENWVSAALPTIALDPASCVVGGMSCTEPEPDVIAPWIQHVPDERGDYTHVQQPDSPADYHHSECPGQWIWELPLLENPASFSYYEIWSDFARSLQDDQSIPCTERRGHTTAWIKKVGQDWEFFESFDFRGEEINGSCFSYAVNRIPDQFPPAGYADLQPEPAWTIVPNTPDLERIRLAVVADHDCTPLPVNVIAYSTDF